MTPTEALALLASVDDPHVVEAGRVLGAIGVSYHKWTALGMDAERAAIVAYLRGLCADPAHDDRWCWTCDLRADLADAIERGAHREGE